MYNANNNNNNKWKRAIILVDMNCFFAAIEQLDHPQWRKKPLVVTNGSMGTCIITSSYEARYYGIKTGMRLRQAMQLCPQLIHAPSRPERYTEISMLIMEALKQVTPDIEIFSIDEAFLDITKCLHLYESPIAAAKLVKKIIYKVSNLPCSIGLSGDKTTAKYAAESKKPNGFTVIPPWEAEQALANVKVTELCGIGNNIGRFLAQYDVIYCKDMMKLPIGILAKRFGNLGRKMWLMCQGKDPDPIHTEIGPPKSLGHGKILPPQTNDLETIKAYLMYMTEKVAARLRHNNMYSANFFIGIYSEVFGWLAIKYKTGNDTSDSKEIYQGCKKLLKQYPEPGIVRQVQITALTPKSNCRQLSLFDDDNLKHTELLNNTIDNINNKFGSFTVASATLLNYFNSTRGIHLKKTKILDVISPAWRPSGARKSV